MGTKIRNSCGFAVLCASLFASFSSLIAGAAWAEQRRGQAPAEPLPVIALQYKLFDASGRQRGGVIAVGDSAQVRVGETVRLELVGSAIIDNVGKEVPIQANFEVAAGKENIDLGRTGLNWAVVTVRDNAGNGLAQVGFTVTGNYKMRGGNTFGRLTLKIAGNQMAPQERPQPGYGGGYGNSAARARELTDTLYRAILNTRASGSGASMDYNRILDNGYGGVIDVARALARDAEQQGFGRSERDRGYESDDVRRMGGLYRDLLKRQQSDSDLWGSDGGFQENVRQLHRRNLTSVIETIVQAQEFKRVWGFDGPQGR